jgi:anaerobic selenocysteine-containing dehydrogenase
MRFTRRGFLGLVGGTAGASVLAGRELSTRVGAIAADVERWATPEQELVPSICQQCPGGCGLIARTLDGELAGISGNRLHPVNRGRLCPKAFGGLQLLYDTNRVKGPMVRSGERGRFRAIGWDEALAMVSTHLSELRTKGLAHTLMILGGQYRGYRDTLWRRFAEAYGTPNYIRVRCLSPDKPALAHRLMQGVTSPLSYDLANAQLILSFGAGLLESWTGPVHTSQAFARLRRSPERQRGMLVQVDPHRSATAAKADRWIPIVPGTDGVLALGIANVMIREGLFDEAFVEQHTFGFDDWVDSSGQAHLGFKNLVLKEYGLLTVSTATGVPVKSILEIARNLGTMKPAVIIGERGPAYGPDDLHTRMAIHSLNALVGNIGIPGGILIQGDLPLAPFPGVDLDAAAQHGNAQPRIDGAGDKDYLFASDVPQVLPERISGGTPYPVNALFLYATNPLANLPAKELMASALRKVPFIVSFSPVLDESSSMADLILPDHTYLERWQDDQMTYLAGFTCFSVAPPASKPLYQTRNTADVVLDISHSLGGAVAANLPWSKFEDMIRDGARGLYEAHRGYVVSAPAAEALTKVLEREGYWESEFKDFDAFWDALIHRGAWWDPSTLPISRRSLLNTPSGKFEFYSTTLKQMVDASAAPTGKEGADKPDDLLYLPAVTIRSPQIAESFPLHLVTYRLMSRPMGGGKDEPWLLEQPAVHLRATWDSWVEVHPETAANLGIRQNDWVWVESAKGRIKIQAKIYHGTVPDFVHIPLYGGIGPNPNDLIANETDKLRGIGLLNTTRVRIRRV